MIDYSLLRPGIFISHIFMCNASHKLRVSECIIKSPKIETWKINSATSAKMSVGIYAEQIGSTSHTASIIM